MREITKGDIFGIIDYLHDGLGHQRLGSTLLRLAQ